MSAHPSLFGEVVRCALLVAILVGGMVLAARAERHTR